MIFSCADEQHDRLWLLHHYYFSGIMMRGKLRGEELITMRGGNRQLT